MEAPSAGPVTLGARIAALDVIRGIALFGILVVNMSFFAGPLADAVYDPSLVDAPIVDRVAWLVESTFFTGKFISLFSFLFGAGLTLQMARMDAARASARSRGERGRSTPLLVVRRMAILLAFGLCHALLLWYGDILVYYAFVGLVLLPLRRFSARTVAAMALAFAALSFACAAGLGALQLLSTLAPAAGQVERANADTDDEGAGEVDDAPTSFVEAFAAGGYVITQPALREIEIATYREGPLADVLAMRALQWASLIPVTVLFYLAHIITMALAGMCAAKARLFDASADRVQRAVAKSCLPIGVALTATASLLVLTSGFDPAQLRFAVASPLGDVGAIVLALGYAALLARLARHPAFEAAMRPIASTGRMALTVYLSETVLMTGLMYWWGFARFATFARSELFVIAIVTWLVLVALSNAWLAFFAMGPMEWLWRIGTYLSIPPLRRSADRRAEASDAT